MTPLALVASLGVVSISRAVYKQAVSYLQTTQPILVSYGHKMILSVLLGEVEGNIRA
jgi:hypothetical protein